MPENPVPPASKPVPPIPNAPITKDTDASPAETDEPVQAPAKPSWLIIALGACSAVLLIVVLVFWGKVSARDRALVESENRLVQIQSGGALLQVQADEARTESARLQNLVNESNAAATQLKDELAKAKTAAAKIQAQLEETRETANDFQTRMAEAKVTSLRHQGEVETAQAQVAVMQTQLTQATTAKAELTAQLAQAKALIAELQTKLGNAEKEIVRLQKPPAKK